MKLREQMKILLWKNWTLKKRNIGLTLTEIIIPLILFMIMLILRLQVAIEPKDSAFHEAKPLPSAGLIPVLQSFCSNTSGSRNPDSFRDQSGSVVDITFSILTVLTDWLFPKRPPGKPNTNAEHQQKEFWQHYKQLFRDGKVDLQSLWEKHEEQIIASIERAEYESMFNQRFAQGILREAEVLSELVDRRQSESPQPYAEDKPLPAVCAAYVNQTRPPDEYEHWQSDNGEEDLFGSTLYDSTNGTSSNGTTNWLDQLAKIWSAAEAVVCSEPSSRGTATFMFGDSSDGNLDKIPIEDIIMRALSNNPKILYGPIGTEAERIVNNIFGTLGIFDDITQLSYDWLRLSKQIKESLNETLRLMKKQQAFQDNMQTPAFLVPASFTAQTTPDSSTSEPPSTEPPSTEPSSTEPPAATQSTTTQAPTARPTIPRNTRPGGPREIIKRIILNIVKTMDWIACRWLSLIGEDINLRNLFKGFRTEAEMVNYFLRGAKEEGVAVLASIYFNVNEDGTLPEHMVYKIRQNATISQSTKLVKDLIYEPGPDWKSKLYYLNGFVWLQDLAERSIIDVYAGGKGDNDNVLEPGIYVEQTPTTCYRKDDIAMVLIEHLMPLVMMLSWVFPVAMLTRGIVYEKELRLKEMMKLMGLARSVHWVGWFIVSFVQMSITMTALTLALAAAQLLAYTNVILLWLILLNFGLNAVLFSFFLSIFFTNAKIAAACSGIFWILTYVPYMFIAILENGGQPQHFALKTTMSLFSTTGLGLSAKYINFLESSGIGLQFDNANGHLLSEDRYSVLIGVVMSLASSAIYIILIWYIDNIMPGDYGVPAPWYFPFTRTYWCGRPNPTAPKGLAKNLPDWAQDTLVKLGFFSAGTLAERMVEHMKKMHHQDPEEYERFFEEEPKQLKRTVYIQNLTKIYPNGKLAVNDLSLNLYEGQILSFLGHNGAGKTTTMSILTGMIPATSGVCSVYGLDLRRNLTEIRKQLGMCPQHNVLFESMTVEEHLKFYCRLKGTPRHSVDLEVEAMLSDSGLREKRDNKVESLSGGMKRKLSIGIAFISGSRTVILDEPTAGVDPWSRREIWDLILKFKHERTIMLSTHHMDEADILGDRIAVISHGHLKCSGSSLFLKGTFGEGYHLIIAKKTLRAEKTMGADMPGLSVVEPESAAELKDTSAILTRCSELRVTRSIQTHVSTAYLRAETPRELHYILPFAEIRSGRCDALFDYLDKWRHRLDIESYGVSDTSLEEVFIKVTMEAKAAQGEAPLAAVQADAEVGAGALNEVSVRRTSDASIQSLPARLRRSLRGSKRRRQRAYEEEAAAEEEVSVFTVEDSHGRVYTPDPIRREQARRRSGRRQRSNSATNREDKADGDATAANPPREMWELQRSFSADPTLITDREEEWDGEQPRVAETGLDKEDIIPAKDRVEEGAGSYQVTGFRFLVYQFQTCLYKKAVFSLRNVKALISQILLPVVFVTFAMFVGLIGGPRVRDEPPLDMSVAQYFNVSGSLSDHYIPFGKRTPSYTYSYNEMPWNIMKTFDLPSGVGATCVLTSTNGSSTNATYGPECEAVMAVPESYQDDWDSYSPESEAGVFADPVKRYYPNCQCYPDKRGMRCDEGGYTRPPEKRVITRDIIQNITGNNMTEFLYYTSDNYKLSRYGAMAFGYDRPHVPYWLVNLPLSLEHIYIRQAAKAIYDTKGWHSMPTYINAINNAILRANMPKERGNPAAYGISVINHPMNGTSSVNASGSLIFGAEFIIAIMVVIGLAFIPAGFILFLVQERSTKAKHLQFVSGLSPIIYWLSNIVWDMLMYLLPAAFCCIIFKAFGVKAFASNTNYPAVVVLVLIFGWSCTPVLYPASFLFKEASAAYVFLAIFNILLGVGCLFITFLLDYFRKAELLRVSETLKSVFVIFPSFALGRGLMDIVLTSTANEVNELIGRPERYHPFDWKVTGRNNVAMVGVGAICYILTILIEYKFFVRTRVVPVQSIAPVEGEDPDVAAERERVLHSPSGHDMVRLENLTKIYRGSGLQGKHLAVHRLCLGVPKGECFGMLGVNGAGKTTTFKMLTGDHSPTGGDAYIANNSILKKMTRARRNMGYCPQFDALFEELTARQHLTIYARLRGVPPAQVPAVVDWALKKLELTMYADRPAGTYSGGNKRKLSTALALLGNPPVIFLDEPTAGMDPYAKRFLWDLILGLIEEGRCIILTSHSMEECETLCTRLAIMVAGRFRCLGSVQHLKSRFGGGYGLNITVPGPQYAANMRRVMQFVSMVMPLVTLKEKHHNMIEYEFTPTDYKLSFVFTKMRKALAEKIIVDYSLCQHTLDNVFIDFVKEQAAKANSEGRGVTELSSQDDLRGLSELSGVENPLYANLHWLNSLSPEQRRQTLEDVLIALTHRLTSTGQSLDDVNTWNHILAILKGSDAPHQVATPTVTSVTEKSDGTAFHDNYAIDVIADTRL